MLTDREQLAYDELLVCRQKLDTRGIAVESIDAVLTALEPPKVMLPLIPDWDALLPDVQKAFRAALDDGTVRNSGDTWRLVRVLSSVPA